MPLLFFVQFAWSDRTFFLYLKRITEEQRRPEQELWAEFEKERPRLLARSSIWRPTGCETLLRPADRGCREWPTPSGGPERGKPPSGRSGTVWRGPTAGTVSRPSRPCSRPI